MHVEGSDSVPAKRSLGGGQEPPNSLRRSKRQRMGGNSEETGTGVVGTGVAYSGRGGTERKKGPKRKRRAAPKERGKGEPGQPPVDMQDQDHSDEQEHIELNIDLNIAIARSIDELRVIHVTAVEDGLVEESKVGYFASVLRTHDLSGDIATSSLYFCIPKYRGEQ
jgi:hypothetical protein